MFTIDATVHVNNVSVRAAGITFTPVANIQAPVTAGTLVGNFTVSPPTWRGVVTIVQSSKLFSVNEAGQVRTIAPIPDGGDYKFQLGAMP